MRKSAVIIPVLGALLTTSAVWGYYAVKSKNAEIAALENELKTLREKEKRSAIDREISRQLEAIAFQQEAVSDERRQEAERQSAIARMMTQKADEERLRAISAQREAEISEKKALDALENAEKQRLIAEDKQREAEYSKSVVDTLSYLGLGRSLASLSSTKYIAGEKEMATLLAGASCYFTTHYNGDLYEPSVFRALSLAGGGGQKFQPGEGCISATAFLKDGSLISVSTYGEIFHCENNSSKVIFRNKELDFRALALEGDGTGYALSFTGELVKIQKNTCTRIALDDMARAKILCKLSSGNLIIATANKIALFDTKNDKIVKTADHLQEITCIAACKLFDAAGKMYEITENIDLKPLDSKINTTVTAYTEALGGRYKAFGTKDGSIYYCSHDGKITELTGHRSKITALSFTPYGLLSSSLDKTVRLWTANSGKVEPITVHTAQNWVMCMAVREGYSRLVSGDAGGAIEISPISADEMLSNLKQKLTREMSADEWNYYIGKNIQQISIKDRL